MSDKDRDTELEAFFGAARDTAPVPGDDLVARVLADAAAVQPRQQRIARPARQSWFRALGGWPSLAGLATATIAGVTIGVADPATVGDLAFYGLGDGYDFSTLGDGFNLGFEDG